MPITTDEKRFNNIYCKNILSLYCEKDVSLFQFKITKGRRENYNYEINQHMMNKKMLWSKQIHFDKFKNKYNILFIIDNNSTDICLMYDTDNRPRDHWLDKFNTNGIIEMKLIGKLYLPIDDICKLFNYKNLGKQGKFQRIRTSYNDILSNLNNNLNS